MSPAYQWALDDLAGFPRVSGDEPTLYSPKTRASSFSPRERG